MERFSPVTAARHPASTQVRVRVVHGDGLLGRIAVLLNNYEITSFSYVCEIDGPGADVLVTIRGTGASPVRLAARLRRVIGVTDVNIV